MSQAAIARQVAFDILRRVSAGAHAADLLVQLTAALESRDAGLAAEITLGVLRRQGQLDALIAQFSRTPLAKLDPEILTGLRMALYQLTFLDRVPQHAAVNDTLNLLHGRSKTRVHRVCQCHSAQLHAPVFDRGSPPGRPRNRGAGVAPRKNGPAI